MNQEIFSNIKSDVLQPAGSGKALPDACIVHVAAEVAPFSKKGGLGDVVASLPVYLGAEGGMENIVFTPWYFNIAGELTLEYSGKVIFNGVYYEYSILSATLKDVKHCFVKMEDAYSLDDTYIDGSKPYLTDVGLQYFMMGKCVIDFLANREIPVHTVITHDWHAAGVYAYLEALENRQKRRLNSIHVIHNYHHQGQLYSDIFQYLESELVEKLERVYKTTGYCNLSLLAIQEAKHIVTVSPTYAAELTNKTAPHTGLDLFKIRKDRILGILNGIDISEWSPEMDRYITIRYDRHTLENKQVNRKHLINKLSLDVNSDLPVVLLLTRLTSQKGIDLFVDIKSGPAFNIYERMRRLLDKGISFVICGVPAGGLSGSINQQLCLLQEKFPLNFRYINFYTEEIAHQLLAGADILIQPSRYEPCGLTQLYAMRYGTVPVVTPVGGLKDTVVDFNEYPGTGYGFYIKNHTFEAILDAVGRAVAVFQDKTVWKNLMERCMKANYTWETSVKKYLKLINE